MKSEKIIKYKKQMVLWLDASQQDDNKNTFLKKLQVWSLIVCLTILYWPKMATNFSSSQYLKVLENFPVFVVIKIIGMK